jgi:hypothetical protein
MLLMSTGVLASDPRLAKRRGAGGLRSVPRKEIADRYACPQGADLDELARHGSALETVGAGLAVGKHEDLQDTFPDVDDPVFMDARGRIDARLGQAILRQGTIGNFDDEQGVVRMLDQVVERTAGDDREVRLGNRPGTGDQRKLYANRRRT